MDEEKTTCRRCSECVGMSHHWMPDPMPYSDESWAPGDYACKHCPVRGDECGECDGTGYGSVSPAYVQAGEIVGPDASPCEACKGEGVIQLTEEEWAHEYQLRAEDM